MEGLHSFLATAPREEAEEPAMLFHGQMTMLLLIPY